MFAAIPEVSPAIQALINIILAGIVTVITFVSANSPAPAPATPVPVPADVAAHAATFSAHAIGADGEAKVEALTGFKVSIWDKARAAAGDTHVAANHYKKTWNSGIDAGGFDPKYKLA